MHNMLKGHSYFTCVVFGLPLCSVLDEDVVPRSVELRSLRVLDRVLRNVVVVVVARGRNVEAREKAVEDVAQHRQRRHHDEVDET